MQQENKRERVIQWENPLPAAGQATKMSGLAYLRAITAGEIPRPPIGILTMMNFVEINEGHVIFSLEPHESHYNPIGTVHGGIIATICDSAASCAVHSTLPAGVAYTTLELKTNFVRAVTVKTGLLHCIGTVIHSGRRMATSEARLVDANNKLYAHATATCMIFPVE